MAVTTEGEPCWVEAALPDVEAGRRFYGALFGWTFRDSPRPGPGASRLDAYLGDRLAAALVPKGDGRMPTVWNVYLAATDVRELGRTAEAAGGRVIVPPHPADGRSTAAMAADPGGAVFGLRQAGDRSGGFEVRGEPGAYCWTELWTWYPDRADPFYERVFGYTATDLPAPGSGPAKDPAGPAPAAPPPAAAAPAPARPVRLWSPRGARPGEETAVAGRSVLTSPAFPVELPDHFLVYFRVKNSDDTAVRVTELGGRVRAHPFDIPQGRIAVFTDNQGADFAVLAEP
jgi:uncharacterized protein